jgi:RNA-directed DNA polymerase
MMIKSPKRLAFLLGFDLSLLKSVSNNIDRYYYEDKKLKTNEDGTPRIKDGRKVYRVLYPSFGVLKRIQGRIQVAILRKIDFPNNIQGSIKGKSNVTNAKLHKGDKYFLCTDLSNYYPSIGYKLIYQAFLDLGFSFDISSLLTKLTTYKYCLPQGTPTSPYLANLVFKPYDKKLIVGCEIHRLKYSRYVDDIVISGKKPFKSEIPLLLQVIFSSPFKLNHKKTFYKIGPTLVTGIITKNNKLAVREDQIEKFEGMTLNKEQKRGLEEYFKQVYNA